MINQAILDRDVEITRDDRGRIVLLPPDRRAPVRLTPEDARLLPLLQDGLAEPVSTLTIPAIDKMRRWKESDYCIEFKPRPTVRRNRRSP